MITIIQFCFLVCAYIVCYFYEFHVDSGPENNADQIQVDSNHRIITISTSSVLILDHRII